MFWLVERFFWSVLPSFGTFRVINRYLISKVFQFYIFYILQWYEIVTWQCIFCIYFTEPNFSARFWEIWSPTESLSIFASLSFQKITLQYKGELDKATTMVKIMKIGSGCIVKAACDLDHEIEQSRKNNGGKPKKVDGSCHFSYCKSWILKFFELI